jgi:multidrug efflux pump subunit AcrB
VNLLPKSARETAKPRDRQAGAQRMQPIADRFGARIKVAEVPPGPPVLETLVAEVYGPDQEGRLRLAREVRDLFKRTAGVVDVDWYVDDDQTKYKLVVDEEKAALSGISDDDIARTVQVASAGYTGGPVARGFGEGRYPHHGAARPCYALGPGSHVVAEGPRRGR